MSKRSRPRIFGSLILPKGANVAVALAPQAPASHRSHTLPADIEPFINGCEVTLPDASRLFTFFLAALDKHTQHCEKIGANKYRISEGLRGLLIERLDCFEVPTGTRPVDALARLLCCLLQDLGNEERQPPSSAWHIINPNYPAPEMWEDVQRPLEPRTLLFNWRGRKLRAFASAEQAKMNSVIAVNIRPRQDRSRAPALHIDLTGGPIGKLLSMQRDEDAGAEALELWTEIANEVAKTIRARSESSGAKALDDYARGAYLKLHCKLSPLEIADHLCPIAKHKPHTSTDPCYKRVENGIDRYLDRVKKSPLTTIVPHYPAADLSTPSRETARPYPRSPRIKK